jgi:hypothetical protein
MKNLLILGTLLIGSYSTCYSEETTAPPKEISQVGIGVEVEAGDDGYDDDDGGPIIWVGPGLYYGIWFDNEWDYNDWYNHHHYGHHGDHHDGGHHGGGGHHDGGGHGGGGHH